MNYPHTITIMRDVDPATVDSVFGQPTIVDQDPVYSGNAWVQQDIFRMRRLRQGSEELDADALVYLPAGEWNVLEDDVVTAGEHVGRVTTISHFTSPFYTRLMVKWLGGPA